MVIQKVTRGVIDLGHRYLEVDLGLDQIQFRLSELGLGVQNEKNGLGAQLIFAFVRDRKSTRLNSSHRL